MISEKSSLKDLIERSPYHSWWGEKEYELYVALPVSLGQCLVLDGLLTYIYIYLLYFHRDLHLSNLKIVAAAIVLRSASSVLWHCW